MKRHRSFWKSLYLWARAGAMADARKKRIMRENLETWNRDHRAFINKCDREEAKAIDRKLNRTSYLGYNPMDGSGWKYVDDESSSPGYCGNDSSDGDEV